MTTDERPLGDDDPTGGGDPLDVSDPSGDGDPAGAEPVTAPRERGPVRGPLLVVAAAWLVVLVMVFLQLWLATWLWVLVLLVDALVAAVVLGLVVSAATTLAKRRRFLLATGVAVSTVALLASFAVVDWRPVYAYGWYTVNRPGFTEIAALAGSDSLARAPSGNYDLPGTLGLISVNGEASWCGRSVLLVPALLWAPDGGAGFVHVPDGSVSPSGEGFCDANGDQIQRRVALGGGWWWAD